MWTVFNTFFLIGSLPMYAFLPFPLSHPLKICRNLVYIRIFFFAASYFTTADGYLATADALKKADAAFASVAGMLG